MTGRRSVILNLAVAAVLLPRAIHAEAPAKARRVGLLMSTTPAAAAHIVAAFVDGLRERGHAEGKDVVFEYRWAESHAERFAELAADLVRQRMDVIVASSQAAALASARATKTIPIVMVNASDPVEARLVASLARPGGNVTGLAIQAIDLAGKRLELLRELVPGLRALAVLTDVSYDGAVRETGEVQAAARTLGLEVVTQEIRRAEDIAPAFAALKGRGQAVYLPSGPILFSNRARIDALAQDARLPLITVVRDYAASLISYGPDYAEQFRRAADYVDKILRGAKPGEIPVEQPTKFDLVVNLRTAKSLGLTIPESFLLRADAVIE